ncbi:KAP family P-loop NTPase fold protein [Candidatus Poriferisocius sp.]|uniref:KAP family P-loop NTPase fold protein n=1 Tax=Candidatus Poriferisocius sp. TaxID=3101276 RepID=UPI003B01717B
MHPVEFTADKESPFAGDRLNRGPHVEALCRVLCGVDGHAVVSLDAPWGAGKTAFVKMCAAHLRSEGVRVVEFNAWQRGHTGNPLLDLVAAVSDQIGESKTAQLRKTGANVAWHLANVGSRGLVDRDAFRGDEPEILADWNQAEEESAKFAERLEAVASADEGPLVVLIDELDRCRPPYALSLLETVRHLFAADGVMVVLAVNRAELRHSVKSVYGPKFDADWYLRRFADLHISLPPPDEQSLSAFLDGLLESSGLSARFTTSSNSYSPLMLKLLAESPGRSLRDLEQAVHLAVVALASLAPSDQSYLSRSLVWEHAAVALIVFRALDEAAYQNLAHNGGDGFAAVAAFDKALGLEPDPQDGIRASDRIREQIEAFLISGSSDDPFFSDSEKEEFLERYTSAIGCLPSRAERVFNACKQNSEITGGARPQIKLIADLIDLVRYTPIQSDEDTD